MSEVPTFRHYKPTKGDLAYSREVDDLDDVDAAIMLRRVSDEYLAVLFMDNQGTGSSSFRALIEFELQRRSAVQTNRSNMIAAASALIAAAALVVQILQNLS